MSHSLLCPSKGRDSSAPFDGQSRLSLGELRGKDIEGSVPTALRVEHGADLGGFGAELLDVAMFQFDAGRIAAFGAMKRISSSVMKSGSYFQS